MWDSNNWCSCQGTNNAYQMKIDFYFCLHSAVFKFFALLPNGWLENKRRISRWGKIYISTSWYFGRKADFQINTYGILKTHSLLFVFIEAFYVCESWTKNATNQFFGMTMTTLKQINVWPVLRTESLPLFFKPP